MEKKLNDCNHNLNNGFASALKVLERVSEIAVKLGAFPGDVSRLKEQELEILRKIYLKR